MTLSCMRQASAIELGLIYIRGKLWELSPVQKEQLNQQVSPIGVNTIINRLLGIRRHLSHTNTRKAIDLRFFYLTNVRTPAV